MKSPLSSMPAARHDSTSELEHAFFAFNQMSEQLGSAWSGLESQVSVLSRELAESRSARIRDLADKERLADKLSTLMAALPGAVVVINQRQLVEEFNPSAQRLLPGLTLGQPWQQVVDLNRVEESDQEHQWITPDGRYLAVVYSELSAEDAQIAMLTDVTESHRRHEVVYRQQRLQELGDMAARLAHQVRTPLHAAMLFLSHADTGSRRGAPRPESLLRAKQQLRRIERLVEGTLTFLRGETDCPQDININELVRSCCGALEPQVETAGGVLRLALPNTTISTQGHRESLDNALTNLLDNALQACDVDPCIEVSLACCDGNVEIRVTDNGIGISAELQERIFEPWFSRRQNGTGLGLAVVSGAMAKHHGDVTVANNHPEGSSFLLRFPLEPTREER